MTRDSKWIPDYEQAKSFLAALCPDGSLNRCFSFEMHGDVEGKYERPLIAYLEPSELGASLFVGNVDGAGVYVYPNETELPGRDDEHVVAVRSCFCDFEGTEAPSLVSTPAPSMIVRTGRGDQIYWLLQEGQSKEQWIVVQRELAATLGAASTTGRLSCSMRIPGYFDRRDEPVVVQLVECYPERRYTLDQIAAAHSLPSSAKDEVPAPAPTPVGVDPKPSGEEADPEPDPEVATEGPGNGAGERSVLATRVENELGHSEYVRPSWEMLDICEAAMAVDEGDWKQIGEILKAHDALGDVLEALHKRAERCEVASWVDREIRKDRAAATHKEVVETAWDAMSGDGLEWEQITAVLEEHGLFDEVVEVVQREHTGTPPETAPPPTDEDKRKGDPRAPGGPLDPEQDLSFRVSQIRKIDSRPAVYYVQIDGAYELRMNRRELRSVELFSEIYFEELNKEPIGMPAGQGKNVVWRELLSRWMREPEKGGFLVVEEQPDESSEGGLIRHTLREILDELAPGEAVEDLDHGRVLPHNDGYLVKQLMLLKAVKQRTGITTIKTEQISEQLRHDEIGAVFKRGLRIDGRQVRVWFFKRTSHEKGEAALPPQPQIH